MKKSLIFLTAALQIVFLLFLVKTYNNILQNGQTVYLRIKPIDPFDLFKGRFINVNLNLSPIDLNQTKDIIENERIKESLNFAYLIFKQENNVSKPDKLVAQKPKNELFLKVEPRYIGGWKSKKLYFNYPIKQYYLNEKLAPHAEKIDLENNIVLARIKILNGVGIIDKILVNNIELVTYLKNLK